MGKFISTYEIYGIYAKDLENVPYKQALLMKRDGVKLRTRSAAQKLMRLYTNPKATYEEISKQQSWLKYLLKAETYTENLLDELSQRVEI